MINAEEQHVIDVLREAHVVAAKIPESVEQSPDVLAHDDVHRYLIEVKRRTDDERIKTNLKTRGAAYRRIAIAPSSTPSAILQDAVGQLDATNILVDFKLIWVCVRSEFGSDPALARQMLYTIYGIRHIFGSGRADAGPPCFFFDDSTFYRYRQIAGVVIDSGGERQLCLNPFSQCSQTLAVSRLGTSMGGNIVDPEELERMGPYLIAACDADRRQPDLVLQYLTAKYGIERPVPFNVDGHIELRSISSLDVLDTDDDDVLIIEDL